MSELHPWERSARQRQKRKMPPHAAFDLALLRDKRGRMLRCPDGSRPIERGEGICRWCGCIIRNPKTGERHKRQLWHRKCADAYLVCTNTERLRHHLWTTRPHSCAKCGCDVGAQKWEADHVVALHLVDRTDPLAFRFWRPSNLRILCVSCHKQVTAKQARQRAAMRAVA